MIHLDTNFLIDALVPGSAQEAKLVGWLSAGQAIGISAIAWGEFLCGPLSPSAEAAARQLLPSAVALHRADAEHAAKLFNQTAVDPKVSTTAASPPSRSPRAHGWRRAIQPTSCYS